jgi:hypothetical protein
MAEEIFDQQDLGSIFKNIVLAEAPYGLEE